MRVIRVSNVSEALVQGMRSLKSEGVRVNTRNGPAIQHPSPVTTITEFPNRRVLFSSWRDANPFFHFYESLWMLAGRRDITPLTKFVKRMRDYSDDDVSFNAAYGYRWRHARTPTNIFTLNRDRDQLKTIINVLKDDHSSRQCVLQIWDHHFDLGTQTRDHACNVAATFQIMHGKLNMVVFCRSNDAIWGAHGANAVHFSVLQEYVSSAIGVDLGTMTQISVNYHAYEEVLNTVWGSYLAAIQARGDVTSYDPYVAHVTPYRIVNTSIEDWDDDVMNFVTDDGFANPRKYNDPFFNDVALPIVLAHDEWTKKKDGQAALKHLSECKATDWQLACEIWIRRRDQGSLSNA